MGPLGVFDSGLGGLTVLQQIRGTLPDLDLCYLGDNARVPYGNRSFETVYQFTREGVYTRLKGGAPLVVVACNTASALGVPRMKEVFEVPVVGVVVPGAKAAVDSTKNKTIGVIGTPGTITGGNPNLRPEYTWGVDTALEYYIPGNGLLSASFYHRWVDNVLFDSRTRVDSDIYNSGGINRTGYDLVGTLNGDNGKLYGLELAWLQNFTFLPGALSGFGFQGNISFIGGSFDTFDRTGADFPGTSDRIINASLFYEKFGLSARVSYQWRSDWVDTLGGFGAGSTGDERRAGREQGEGGDDLLHSRSPLSAEAPCLSNLYIGGPETKVKDYFWASQK